MREDAIQRPRHPAEIERVDEQGRGLDLPAAAGAEETPKLLLMGPSLPRRLLLEGAEGFKVTLRIDDPFHGAATEGADKLVLQIRHAHVEAESFHIGASEVAAEAGPLETSLEVALLRGVTQARQPDVGTLRAEQVQEASDVLRSPHRHDGNALIVEGPTAAPSESSERELVAHSLDEHDRPRREGLSRLRGIDVAVDPCVLMLRHPRGQ
jgi:hypothetical protein